ncbi:MAG: hypothetical protein KIT84_28725 [Labilithrix sp.]|nr:hypothetical protein [Labilithrix sp.]MCW5815045.1 hypothetical protein [Labilithrix sp.]
MPVTPKKPKPTSGPFRGVYPYVYRKGEWRILIVVRNRAHSISGYSTAVAAAIAYDRAARYYGLPEAYLNFPDREHEPASIEDLRHELTLETGRREPTTKATAVEKSTARAKRSLLDKLARRTRGRYLLK